MKKLILTTLLIVFSIMLIQAQSENLKIYETDNYRYCFSKQVRIESGLFNFQKIYFGKFYFKEDNQISYTFRIYYNVYDHIHVENAKLLIKTKTNQILEFRQIGDTWSESEFNNYYIGLGFYIDKDILNIIKKDGILKIRIAYDQEYIDFDITNDNFNVEIWGAINSLFDINLEESKPDYKKDF